MPFGDNIIAHTQSKTGTLPGGFGGEKGLEDLFFDGLGNTIAIVFYANFNSLPGFLCTNRNRWFIFFILRSLGEGGFLFYCIKGIGNEI